MLEVSRSGYNEWRDRRPSAAARRRERLRQMITAVFEVNHETYGYRRVHAVLVRSGEQVSSGELVRQLMRELGLVSCQPRPWRPSTTQADSAQPAIPDLVQRNFTAIGPGVKLVGDITYIPSAPRGASLYPQRSWEELEGRFLGDEAEVEQAQCVGLVDERRARVDHRHRDVGAGPTGAFGQGRRSRRPGTYPGTATLSPAWMRALWAV